MEKLAVVILNYNGQAYLEQFLPNVVAYSRPYKVYVADNASTDNSISWLKHNHPEVSLIVLKENFGFAEGYNQALSQVEATYYVLLNSDVEVTPNWLSPLVKTMDDHPELGAIQPKILSYHQKEYFEYAGAGGGYIDALGYPFCRGRLFDTLEKDEGQYDDFQYTFWATGACLLIRSELYHQSGGLDKDFFAHMEEIDLCWRLQLSGHKIGYSGESLVYHVGGGTLNKESPKKTWLNFRNNLIMMGKNLPASELIRVIGFRTILDLVAALKYAAGFKFQHAMMVLKAHLYFYGHLKEIWRKRIKSANHRRFASFSGVIPHFIVLEYFVKKKKTFTSLKIPYKVLASSQVFSKIDNKKQNQVN